MRIHEPDRDFIRIRDFLNETYSAFPNPYNWGLERWNYARYFVAPFIGAYGLDKGEDEASLKAIALWEEFVRVWEDVDSNIVGVTCIEHPDPRDKNYGEIFVQRHPDYVDLLEEMIVFAEAHYVNPEMNRAFMWVYEDDTNLIAVLKARGFVLKEGSVQHHLEYTLGDLPPLELPEGFQLLSMAEENDIDKRREIFGRGFNHQDPKEWGSAFSYRELQKAPDYRKEHDLFIVAPDGTYTACCIVWYDEVNRVGHLEPLGTHPDYRRMGLATQIQFEGMRRLQTLGATYMPMTGGFEPFYRAVGFVEKKGKERPWIKTL
ncbi:MAG: GNAT family N-acetyltransferase [Candidatus Bipolaricaulota bacterium]